MNPKRTRKLLAVDVRAQRFGYAVLESPARLVDSGVRAATTHRRTGCITDLLKMYQPAAVVLRRAKAGGKRDTPGARGIMRIIKREARQFGVSVALVGEGAIRKFFRSYSKQTKGEIAPFIAACFPELRWKVPPRRKPWKAEARRMSVFDAVQLGIVFLALRVGDETVSEILAHV